MPFDLKFSSFKKGKTFWGIRIVMRKMIVRLRNLWNQNPNLNTFKLKSKLLREKLIHEKRF